MSEGRMSPEDFDASKHKLAKLTANTCELARKILVEGVSKKDAAEAVGMKPQNVAKAMLRVEALLSDLPANFVWYEGYMPEDMAVSARKAVKDAREQAKK